MLANNRGMSFLAVTAAVAVGLLAPQTAVGAGAGSFSLTGSLPFPRSGAVAAPLPDGRVLVAGGVATLFNQTVFLSSALVFDPTTNGFSSAGIGDMGTARTGAAAAPLPDGRVLVAGGDNGSSVLASAEVFDPATNSFSPVGSMGTVRRGAAAATLGDGRVLVSGGNPGTMTTLFSAEVFNPATNSFSSTGIGNMATARREAVAAPLPDGRVVVAGGYMGSSVLASAEVFDPATNGFSPVGSMGTARYQAVAAPLPDGRVLVAGGNTFDSGVDAASSAEVFDPTSNAFGSAGIGSMGTPRREAAAATLGDGRVLVASGLGAQVERLESAEIFAASNAFSYRVRGKRLLVTVEASGTVEVKGEKGGSRAASARKRKKRSPLRPSSASGGPGTIAVPLRLGKAAKGKLRRKGKVRVRATITFSPQGGLANSQTAKLKIKAKKKRKGKGR
jgi:Kelch motif